ncbi:hypothetical protein PLESTF_001586200 [Pleodorina starrii]|nr:hypothetical protein PLESTF_001586200 [Pleodorina starrii]
MPKVQSAEIYIGFDDADDGIPSALSSLLQAPPPQLTKLCIVSDTSKWDLTLASGQVTEVRHEEGTDAVCAVDLLRMNASRGMLVQLDDVYLDWDDAFELRLQQLQQLQRLGSVIE